MADIYMTMAIEEAMEGIRNQHGGPFGTVIVKDGKVVGKGHNMVPFATHGLFCFLSILFRLSNSIREKRCNFVQKNCNYTK